MAARQSSPKNRRRRHERRQFSVTHVPVRQPSTARLDHNIFSKGEWKRARLRDHPRVPISISFARLGKHPTTTISDKHAEVSAIADTGAQSDLWSMKEFLASGFSRHDLKPINLSLSAANHSPIPIEGAFFSELTTKSSGGSVASCHSMVYLSSSFQALYLSYESLLNLGLLSHCFQSLSGTGAISPENDIRPGPEDCRNTPPAANATRATNDACYTPNTAHDSTCNCPQRKAAKPRPSKLSFPCKTENNERMRQWLLDRYTASTFNTCPHRALPCMEGPPIEIHVDPAATPRACHTPANVPLHRQQRVKEDLPRDETLGVIERVPYGEPSHGAIEWLLLGNMMVPLGAQLISRRSTSSAEGRPMPWSPSSN